MQVSKHVQLNEGYRVHISPIKTDDSRWRNLYINSKTGHFFQSPEWSEQLLLLPGMEPEHFIMEPAGIRYIVPLIRCKKMGGLISTMMSLPLGTTGGIFSDDTADADVVKGALNFIKKKKPLKITVRCQSEKEKDLFSAFGPIESIDALVLPLDRPYQLIEKECFSSNKRKLVNRGKRRGVVVSRSKDSHDINAYIQLQQKVEKQKGWVTTFSDQFVRKMVALDEADLWLAYIDEHLACAIISFSHNGIVTAWQGILDRELGDCLSTQPMNLLYASMIQYYSETGCTLFDMGYSLGITSLEVFKKGFGCVEQPMYLFTWKSSTYRVMELVNNTFRRIRVSGSKRGVIEE
ncbi:MAG: GNAT family N-acetyltransferase, partial [Fibrobacterota bacterium]